MTEREAIEWLKGCVVSYEVDNKGKPNGNITCDLTQEVLDMAISALEQQEVDKCCETCKHKNRSVEEPPCCDCYMSTAFDDSYEPYTPDSHPADPWDGVKPHAEDGFVAKYCEPYTEEDNE